MKDIDKILYSIESIKQSLDEANEKMDTYQSSFSWGMIMIIGMLVIGFFFG